MKYFLIVNLPNAPVDPGKIGMYSYTVGNTGNYITITGQLAAAASGIAVTTLGQVTWDTGVWVGRNTQTHPIGATIVCGRNAKGVPLGSTIMMGQRAVIRGYGSMRNHRSIWKVDGDFETRKYITSVFGQALRKT